MYWAVGHETRTDGIECVVLSVGGNAISVDPDDADYIAKMLTEQATRIRELREKERTSEDKS